MSLKSALLKHQELCDDVYNLALEENRFLQQNQRVPNDELLQKKKVLLEQLDESFSSLQKAPTNESRDSEFHTTIEKTKSRILQILQLDKENEQLLLRYSLTSGNTLTSEHVNTALLKKIYAAK
jgi:hypothetical protein